MTDDKTSGPRRVGSVRQAAAILRHLEASTAGAGVNAIARALDLSPSSCFNLLKTLVDEDLLEFEPATKRYSLGAGAISLGRRAFDPRGAFQLVRPRLEALADRHQVTTSLWRPRRSDQLMVVGIAESAAAFRIQLSPGQRLPDAAGAVGRCAMAFSGLDDGAIRRRFDAVKWAETPDFGRYLDEVGAVRTRGWAVDKSQYIRGVTTVAVPVLSHEGRFEMALLATLFTGQHPEERLEIIARDLRTVAGWLATALGARSRATASLDPAGTAP